MVANSHKIQINTKCGTQKQLYMYQTFGMLRILLYNFVDILLHHDFLVFCFHPSHNKNSNNRWVFLKLKCCFLLGLETVFFFFFFNIVKYQLIFKSILLSVNFAKSTYTLKFYQTNRFS